MQTTDSKFWEKMGYEEPAAQSLAQNVRNFIAEAIGDEDKFDYAAEYAADYVEAYEIWAKSKGIVKGNTGFSCV